MIERFAQLTDERVHVVGNKLTLCALLGLQCLFIQRLTERLEFLDAFAVHGLCVSRRGFDVLGDIVAHLAPRYVHAEHLAVAERRRLHKKAGLVCDQIAVGLFHHRTAGEHIGSGDHARDKLVVAAADEQQHRQYKVCAERQRIDIIHADVALYFQREGTGDRLAPHVNVIVQTALLNVVILQLS